MTEPDKQPPSVLDVVQGLALEDFMLPPLPKEMYGWGRLWRVLSHHPTALVEVLAAFSSVARAIGFANASDWQLAGLLCLAGLIQVWAVVQRRARLRAWAPLFAMVVLGFAAKIEAMTWPGYLGAVLPQAWIVIRAGRLFRINHYGARADR
jgi:hypothetical protein